MTALVVTSCYRKQDKVLHGGPLGSYAGLSMFGATVPDCSYIINKNNVMNYLII